MFHEKMYIVRSFNSITHTDIHTHLYRDSDIRAQTDVVAGLLQQQQIRWSDRLCYNDHKLICAITPPVNQQQTCSHCFPFISSTFYPQSH